MIAHWLLALAQSPPTPPAQVAPDAPASATTETPPVEPYPGTLADGLAQMQALTDAGKGAEALALGERILAPRRFARWRDEQRARAGFAARALDVTEPAFSFFGFDDVSARERAAVHYARGLAASAVQQSVPAELAFQSARALAGPSELRLAATYDLGVLVLQEGEALRAKIPEISGQAPQPPATPALPGGAGPQEPDPLELARAAYVKAREHLVERVRLDWRDGDTRANLELVARRLKELDLIQKKREEEQQKQEEQESQDEKDSKDQKDQEQKDGEQDPKQDEQQKPEDQKDANKDEPSKPDDPKPEEKPPEQPPEEKKPEDQKPQESPAAPTEQERVLTKEEMTRLLDILNQREQEGQALLEKIRQARRVTVKKDW